jgi:predicted N-formylglutamate amidohydrolase
LTGTLSAADEPHPVASDNAAGNPPFLLVADHAARLIRRTRPAFA